VLALNPRAGLLGGVLGLGLGAGMILLCADALSASSELSDLEQQAGGRPIAVKAVHSDTDLAMLTAHPLFALTMGAGATPEVTVRLDGVAIALGRRAALVAVGPKSAQWLTVGQAVDEVKLLEVHPDGVVVDTPTGIRKLTPTGLPSKEPHPASAGVGTGPTSSPPGLRDGPPGPTPIHADEPPAQPPKH
jgi:hypothetical protein